MKIAIVPARVLAKHRRWDACFYLGNPEILNGDKIELAKRNLLAAQARVAQAEAEQEEERRRLAQLKQEGVVLPTLGPCKGTRRP